MSAIEVWRTGGRQKNMIWSAKKVIASPSSSTIDITEPITRSYQMKLMKEKSVIFIYAISGQYYLGDKTICGTSIFFRYIFKIHKLCFCVTYTILQVDFIDIIGLTLNTNLKRSQQNLKQNWIHEFKKWSKWCV